MDSSSNTNVYFDKKQIYLLGIIDEKTEKVFYDFAEKIIVPELEKIEAMREPMKIHISSPGGYVQESLTIIGLMEHYKEKGIIFETHIRSMSASAATLISSSGSKGHRYCNRYSTIMIHQPSGGVIGDAKTMQDVSKMSHEKWQLMKKIYTKNTNITDEKLNEIYKNRKDWFFKPAYAKSLSFIDHIL